MKMRRVRMTVEMVYDRSKAGEPKHWDWEDLLELDKDCGEFFEIETYEEEDENES